MKTIVLALIGTVTLFAASCASAGGNTAGGGVKPYPDKTCIVSGNELGSMGRPITKVHKDQEVKFCCSPCVKKFDKNPEKYLAGL